MSLFSRKSKEERQAARAERKAAKAAEKERIGAQVAYVNASNVFLTLHENGHIRREENFRKETYSLDNVVIELDDGEALESRFTATRIFLIGVFALAFKKKKGGSKFILVMGDDFHWLEEVGRKNIRQATEFVHAVRAKQRELGYV